MSFVTAAYLVEQREGGNLELQFPVVGAEVAHLVPLERPPVPQLGQLTEDEY